MVIEPIIIAAAQYVLHQASNECNRHEAHHEPSHTAFRQIPFKGNLDEIGVEDNGIDNDGRRKDEVQYQLQHAGRLLHLILVLPDERAAHLRSNDEPDELPDILIQMVGFTDAEDVIERGNDHHDGTSEQSRDDHPEEQLRHHMQAMSSKTAVVKPTCAHQ